MVVAAHVSSSPVATLHQTGTPARLPVCILVLAALWSGSPGVVFADIKTIWAVNDGEKVERDDLSHPAKARNSAWDGKTIRLSAARNEIVAFQVIVEADERGVAALSASLSELRSPAGRIVYVPPAADPTDYVGRSIQLFSINYMHVTSPSHASWVYRRGTPAAPGDPTGWKPVQLVPENARAGKGGFPLSVPARQNQAIWIEIYTGRDRPPGTYAGRVRVTADGERRELPIELEVFDFALPDENSMHAMVYYQPSQPELYQGRNLDVEYHRFAHRQRVELVHAYDIDRVQSALGRFTGADFKRDRKYEGPGQGVGNVIVPASFYNPGKDFDDRESAWKKSDAWMSFLKRLFPNAITFLYMPDEPKAGEFSRIAKIAANVHSNPGPGRALPILVTHRWTEALDPAIDIWCSGPRGYDIERAVAERKRGRDYWFYNGGRPAGGAITIDAPATDARATIWAAFKHDIRVYFYWHGVHWRHNHQKPGNKIQNVWADTITFDSRKEEKRSPDDAGYIHGDGVLMYPGEERLHPDQDRGVPGPVSTVQLANFRRGLQDHQYLMLARRLGLADEVRDEVQAIVPKVFSDAGERVSFPESGDPYEAARLRLGRAIERVTRERSKVIK
jgi:hypothetical protein